jgi:hypothetical protein
MQRRFEKAKETLSYKKELRGMMFEGLKADILGIILTNRIRKRKTKTSNRKAILKVR